MTNPPSALTARSAVAPPARPTARTGPNAGPEIWRLARDAYLGGESAASVCRRLGLTVSALRRRATRKGWSRVQYEAACKRGDEPAEALRDLVARIAQASRYHRHDEVAVLARTAETLARAVRVLPPSPPPPPPAPREPSEADRQAWCEAETERLEAVWEDNALRLGCQLLNELHPDAISDRWTRAAYHWRAVHLGPEQARHDFETGRSGGWAYRYWDEAGKLWPLKEPPKSPSFMLDQHDRFCAAIQRQEAWEEEERRAEWEASQREVREG